MVTAGSTNPKAQTRRCRDKTAVLLVDPRPLAREGLARVLKANAPDLRVVPVEHPSAPVEERLRPNFSIVLLNIAGSAVAEAEVVGAVDAARSRYPQVPMAVLSDREEATNVVAAIDRGVRGYIPMRLQLPLIVEALRLVAVGGIFVPAELLLAAPTAAPAGGADLPRLPRAGLGDQAGCPENLSPRQLAVFRELRRGKSNRAIARDLALPETVVKTEVRNIMRKLGAANRTEIAMRVTS